MEGLGSKQYQLSPRKLKGCQKKKKKKTPKTPKPMLLIPRWQRALQTTTWCNH